MAAAIYKFFSDPHVSDPSDPKNLTYSCYHCGEEKKARLGTPSNLKNHLQRGDHSKQKAEYDTLQLEYEEGYARNSLKRRRGKNLFPESPKSPLLSAFGVTMLKTCGVSKYPKNSKIYFNVSKVYDSGINC